jgi:hypothetical protein
MCTHMCTKCVYILIICPHRDEGKGLAVDGVAAEGVDEVEEVEEDGVVSARVLRSFRLGCVNVRSVYIYTLQTHTFENKHIHIPHTIHTHVPAAPRP